MSTAKLLVFLVPPQVPPKVPKPRKRWPGKPPQKKDWKRASRGVRFAVCEHCGLQLNNHGIGFAGKAAALRYRGVVDHIVPERFILTRGLQNPHEAINLKCLTASPCHGIKTSADRFICEGNVLRYIQILNQNGWPSPAMQKLEQFAKKHSLQILALTHQKKRKIEGDTFNSIMSSVSYRGATDTNISIIKRGQTRILETEQRWGTALEPTKLDFDPDKQEASLGKSIEQGEEERERGRAKETTKRIQSEIMDCLTKPMRQDELLDKVKGKTTTVRATIFDMVACGEIIVETQGKALVYSKPCIPAETLAEAA